MKIKYTPLRDPIDKLPLSLVEIFDNPTVWMALSSKVGGLNGLWNGFHNKSVTKPEKLKPYYAIGCDCPTK